MGPRHLAAISLICAVFSVACLYHLYSHGYMKKRSQMVLDSMYPSDGLEVHQISSTNFNNEILQNSDAKGLVIAQSRSDRLEQPEERGIKYAKDGSSYSPESDLIFERSSGFSSLFQDRRGDKMDDEVSELDARRRGVATCTFNGDVHMKTFDDTWPSFQGSCQYIAARDHCPDGVTGSHPKFEIIVKFHRRYPHKPLTWLKWVSVHLHLIGKRIKLTHNMKLEIDGSYSTAPLVIGGDLVYIGSTPNGMFIAVPSEGLQVSWTGTQLDIMISTQRKKDICGLCGYFDGNPSNDLMVGPATECIANLPQFNDGPGTQTDNNQVFGHSWLHQQDDAICRRECSEPLKMVECTEAEFASAEDECKALNDLEGEFQECLKKLNIQVRNSIFSNCVYDVCATGDTSLVCDHAERLVRQCIADLGVTMIGWRTPRFCAKLCTGGSYYSACGNPCGKSCPTEMIDACINVDACEDGCTCPYGSYWDNLNGQCLDKCPETTATSSATITMPTTTTSTTKIASTTPAGTQSSCEKF